MNKDEIRILLDMLPDDAELELTITDAPIDELPSQPLEPNTRLVEITSTQAYYRFDKDNDSGFPMFLNSGLGRTKIGERYRVNVDFIMGDGGIRWWRIWRGPLGAENEARVYNTFIHKSKTKIV